MPHNLLQVLLDPRAWFAFGIVFFGGFVLAGEISHHRESKRKRPPAEPNGDFDDGAE
jgi:hypothetical protein